MKLTRMAPLMLAMLLGAMRAGASLELDLENTWHNAMPSSLHDMAPGEVTWLSLTFSSNDVVRWQWLRDGKRETHSGTFGMSVQSVPGGRSIISDIVITPSTFAAKQPIVLHGVTIRNDNRFPALWSVMKWFDDAGAELTFVRDSEYEEWKEFLDLLDKAEKADKASKERATPPPRPAPDVSAAGGDSAASAPEPLEAR